MSEAYLPGLTVSELTAVRKTRRLPLTGEVPVMVGDRVKPSTVVAKTNLPGRPHLVAAARLLNIEPGELPSAMVKGVGERVVAGEVLARYSTFFGLFKGQCLAPATGVVEHISQVTGQVVIREPATPVAVKAYISGEVVQVMPGDGVVVETAAALVEGIFGIGGEGNGSLRLAVNSPQEGLGPRQINREDKGCILVGGSLVTAAALRRAGELGVKGIVCGGILDQELLSYLGYEIGVAITGQEDIPLSLVITEGFGEIPMAEKTFTLLKGLQGQEASINGSTQIRAGVLRPEVVVPKQDRGGSVIARATGLEVGSRVRIIRRPWFGKQGLVIGLPVELAKIESESLVRVVQIALEGGQQVVVPRANVEILAG